MAKNVVLENASNELIYPVTTADMVFISEDETVLQRLRILANSINNIINGGMSIATKDSLGGVQVGNFLTINETGLLSVDVNALNEHLAKADLRVDNISYNRSKAGVVTNGGNFEKGVIEYE